MEFRKEGNISMQEISKIEQNYKIEERNCGLLKHIIRKSDGACIATLDLFSSKIMDYEPYHHIMETITSEFTTEEKYVLEHFFGEYFKEVNYEVGKMY